MIKYKKNSNESTVEENKQNNKISNDENLTWFDEDIIKNTNTLGLQLAMLFN
ncbi:hypothetical protein [Mycoplasma tauri]|uniref:hypothetical protein n=1 Tax=Mycoplasma tauri TaxID=547987 RepID=UPI001CBA7613|nr:hypothetical protein [Mycoplasma tauri]MBZ4226608.1 hypothetical protein [Mycoplasma tauri]